MNPAIYIIGVVTGSTLLVTGLAAGLFLEDIQNLAQILNGGLLGIQQAASEVNSDTQLVCTPDGCEEQPVEKP